MAIPSFGSDNNPNYQAIVRIIRNALRDGFSISQVVRAVADAIREYRRKQFMQYHKVKENNGRYYDVPATLSVKDPESEDFLLKSSGGELSESIEHCDLWLRRGKPYLMTTNPYFVSKDELKNLLNTVTNMILISKLMQKVTTFLVKQFAFSSNMEQSHLVMPLII